MANGNTAQDARKIYEDSKAELQKVMNTAQDAAVLAAAQQKLQDLAMGFAADAWNTIESRTANLTTIANKLKEVIQAAGQNPAADALDRVTGITSGLAQIVRRVNALLG